MALYLKVSNSLRELSKQLCIDLQDQKSAVFKPNYIITQTEGMNSWLKFQLAEHLGIAANYRFLKPNDLVQQVFQLLGGQYQQSLSPQNQCWFLYRLLGETEFIDKFKYVSGYYTRGGADKDLKRLALAEKVADLFDQYQMYRPEMIRNWNKGFSTGLAHEDWQMYLWEKARQLSEGSLPDKTFIADYIITALQDPAKQQALRSKIPSIQLVGMSVLTDFHMDLFYLIGEHINLSFYILNPAPSVYWFEDKSEKQVAILKKKKFFEPDEESIGNALLTSWGGVLQNTFSLLFKKEALLNNYEEAGIVEPQEDSLLHKIQADLFYNRGKEDRSQLSLEDLQDGSIVINSNFTLVREVESLYNYLVHLVDQRKEALSARDIVVMVSDIDAYAPYIKAIFHNAPHSFSFTIADEIYTANDSIAGALLSVLMINGQNFKAEGLMQLLDSSYIRKRFGLTDLSIIRKVVDSANFRFGMEGEREDDSVFVSWKYAAQRILYGICMSGGEEYFIEDDSLFPLDILEGNDSLEIIRFSHFMEVLIHSVEERARVRTLSEWVSYVEKVLNNLVFDANEEEDEDYGILMDQLMQYNGLGALSTEKISYQLFNHSFQNAISNIVRSGSFASSGITFCSLIPMRSIPFKVVALLGLNFDKFPRKENPVSFDLINMDKRKGDRNVKENDKHLFLETLLSAQEYLYISYLGQSVKDNSTVPPSLLVDEFIDYIQAECEGINATEELMTNHALHGFSEKYQLGDPRLYSYLNREIDSKFSFGSQEKTDQLDHSEIRMESLINFLKHPIKGYFNTVLSIYYNDEEVLLPETEVFDLDHLQKWNLKQHVLELDLDQLEELKYKLLKTGGLPLRNMATIAVATIEEEVAPVRELFRACTGEAEERLVSIDIDFEELNVNVKGTLNRVYGNKLIVLSWSKNETKYLLEAYIKLLCAKAAGLDLNVYFISAAKVQVFQAADLDSLQAKEVLSDLLSLYMEGHQSILPFSPDFDIKPKDLEGLKFEDFKKKVDSKLSGFNVSFADPYMMNKYKEGYYDSEQVFEQYKENAEKLLLPLEELFADYYQ